MATTQTADTPLVSVLTVCKDAATSIRRCIDSLLAQDYPNLQLVVQDGLSTDGTAEILRAYGDRLDLVSERDRDQNDAFIRGLKRCRGEIVAFCWSDEALMPGAVRRAVALLGARPELGAIYGDFVETDLDGAGDEIVKYPDWDFERVFTYEFIPPVCASFFRRDAIEAYLRVHDLAPDCTEYLLWAAAGAQHAVEHVPHPLARYARHPGQLSMQPDRMSAYPALIVDAIAALVRHPSMPPHLRALQARASAHVHLWAAQWLLNEHGVATDWRRHLDRALDFEPTPLRLVLMHFEALKQVVREERPQVMLDILETTRDRGVTSAGLLFSRSLALFALGRDQEAVALDGEIARAPHVDALYDLVEDLVQTLLDDGQTAVADHALLVFWRLGALDPSYYYRLAVLLGRLGRFDQAIAVAQRHLAAVPGHDATLGLVDQLSLGLCLAEAQLRTDLSRVVGKPIVTIEEGFPFAHAVWRFLLDPTLTRELSGAKRTGMRALVALFEPAAGRAGFGDLAARLATIQAGLADVPPA